MTVEKPKPKQLLRPITTGAGSAMNQSQFLAITCNSLEAREKSRVHGAIGFGFDSHWLKNWRESFKPITKRSNRTHVITFDCHLKTALYLPSATPNHPKERSLEQDTKVTNIGNLLIQLLKSPISVYSLLHINLQTFMKSMLLILWFRF